jgi:hypothetical protein
MSDADETSHARHALYHAMQAFVRVASPTQLASARQTLIGRGQQVSRIVSFSHPIETAILLGALWKAGFQLRLDIGERRTLINEIRNELRAQTQAKQPLATRSHVFVAYQSLAPCMSLEARIGLLESAAASDAMPDEKEIEDDVSAMRYALSYFLQEEASGVMPFQSDDRIAKALTLILATLNARGGRDDGLSRSEAQTRAMTTRLIEMRHERRTSAEDDLETVASQR